MPVVCECYCSGCGGFAYDDIVNKEYKDEWHEQQGCVFDEVPQPCLEECCPPRSVACENNQCTVIEGVPSTTPAETPDPTPEESPTPAELCSNENYSTERDIHLNKITLTHESYLLLKSNNYDLSEISDLTCLEYLSIQYPVHQTPLSDLSPLSNLYNLKYLMLGGNNISDLSPLSDLNKLKSLDLSNNQISDVSPLYNLKNLESVLVLENPLPENACEELKEALPNTKNWIYR